MENFIWIEADEDQALDRGVLGGDIIGTDIFRLDAQLEEVNTQIQNGNHYPRQRNALPAIVVRCKKRWITEVGKRSLLA